MNKSNKQSSREGSELADEISAAMSRPLLSTEGASGSPPSSEPLPLPPTPAETQRIGSMVFPRWAWSSLWTWGVDAVRMKLGGELVQVQAVGRWEPPQPANDSRRPLPQPRHGESHQTYFLRVLALFRGRPHSPEHSHWLTTRRWVGESSNELRDAIAAGQDMPTHSWAFVNEKTQPL